MVWYLMISYDSIAWYCMFLPCWLRRAGCVSQDAYILHKYHLINILAIRAVLPSSVIWWIALVGKKCFVLFHLLYWALLHLIYTCVSKNWYFVSKVSVINSKRPIGEFYSVLRASRPVWSSSNSLVNFAVWPFPKNSRLLGVEEEWQRPPIPTRLSCI